MQDQVTPQAAESSIDSSINPELERLKRKRAKADIYCFSARVGQPYESVETAKNSEKSQYDAVKLPVTVLSRKGSTFERTNPIFSREGKMVIDNAPYDETAVYQITVDNSGKYPEWVSIEKVED